MSQVTFPNLGLEFTMNTVAFSLFGWPVRWYAIIISVGLLLAISYTSKRAKEFAIDPDRMVDYAMVCVITGIIGARLYFVAFKWDYYKEHLDQIVATWTGGIAIYGGIIAGVIGGIVFSRIIKARIPQTADLLLGGLILAQGIGRWANFVNAEAFGSNTSLPWGMSGASIVNYLVYSKDALAAQGVIVDPYAPVHPTFLYESIWCLLGFAFICYYTSRRRFDGELTLFYAGWYGAGRFIIEGLRTDSLMWGPVRVSQAVAAICVIISVAVFIYMRRKIAASGDKDYLRPYGMTEAGKAEVEAVIAARLAKEGK